MSSDSGQMMGLFQGVAGQGKWCSVRGVGLPMSPDPSVSVRLLVRPAAKTAAQLVFKVPVELRRNDGNRASQNLTKLPIPPKIRLFFSWINAPWIIIRNLLISRILKHTIWLFFFLPAIALLLPLWKRISSEVFFSALLEVYPYWFFSK